MLQLDDGRLIAIAAANEALASITCAAPGGLVRIAWHIGNRHLPAQIERDRILIGRDHVIKDMLTGLGASVADVTEPFHPEPGAYHSHTSGHSHQAHSHSHSHSHVSVRLHSGLDHDH